MFCTTSCGHCCSQQSLVVNVCFGSQVFMYRIRILPPPLSVTLPPPSSTTRWLVFTTFAVAFMRMVTGFAPQLNVMMPPSATALTTAAEVQLAAVPWPMTWFGWLVLTARPAGGTGCFPAGLPTAGRLTDRAARTRGAAVTAAVPAVAPPVTMAATQPAPARAPMNMPKPRIIRMVLHTSASLAPAVIDPARLSSIKPGTLATFVPRPKPLTVTREPFHHAGMTYVTEHSVADTAAGRAQVLTDHAQYLIATASRAPSVHNSQPWRFKVGQEAVELWCDPRRRTWSDASGREMLISCGAALFGLRLAVRSLGYQPVVDLLPDSRQLRFLARVRVGRFVPMNTLEGRMLAAVPHRHTHRGPFTEQPLPHGLLVGLQDDVMKERAELALVPRGLQYERLASLAAAAGLRPWQEHRPAASGRRAAGGDGDPVHPRRPPCRLAARRPGTEPPAAARRERMGIRQPAQPCLLYTSDAADDL